MQEDLDRILFDEATILRRLDELAAQITEDYRERELTVIAVLNGSLIFMADLLRRIPLPAQGRLPERGELPRRHKNDGRSRVQTGDAPRRRRAAHSHPRRHPRQRPHPHAVRARLEEAGPRSVRVCVLLEKKIERAAPVQADYVAFEIGNEFVVGYGLDYMERYRNLPCVGVLRKDKISA
jgi:hypoxanthine phosphoribosyltransferase